MKYSILKAELVAQQVSRFAHQNSFQLAGHARNREFWVSESVSALRCLEDYNKRFERLRDGQTHWVDAHETRIVGFCQICAGPCELEGERKPLPPRRIPHDERTEAAKLVRNALRDFLLRLYSVHHVSEEELLRLGGQAGLSFDPADLARPPEVESADRGAVLPPGSPY